MSTLKTTNLQNADASSANIVLGQGSGGGATISGVTTTTSGVKVGSGITLSADGDIFATGIATASGARFTDDGSAGPTVSIQTDDAAPYALNIGNQSYSADTTYGLNLYNNNSGEGYFRHIGNSAYLDYHFSLHNNSSNKLCLKFEADDQSVELYAAGSKKFETDPGGAIVTGVLTATSFSGSGANLTGVSAGEFFGNSVGVSTSKNVGIHTTNVNTEKIVGAANSFVGLYMGDGFIGFPTSLNRNGGYFIATTVNALNAGPVSLGSTMTLHGTWTIV